MTLSSHRQCLSLLVLLLFSAAGRLWSDDAWLSLVKTPVGEPLPLSVSAAVSPLTPTSVAIVPTPTPVAIWHGAPLAAPFAVSDYKIRDFREMEVLLSSNGRYSSNQTDSWAQAQYFGQGGSQNSMGSINFNPSFLLNEVKVPEDLVLSVALAGLWNDEPFSAQKIYTLNQPYSDFYSQAWNQTGSLNLSPSLSVVRYSGLWQWGGSAGAVVSAAKSNSGSRNEFGAAINSSADFSSALGLQGQGQLRAGLGRLVDSRWAWKALELVDELSGEGLLLKPVQPEDMQALSGLIALNGQRLIWDSRELRRMNTRAILAFLREQGYLRGDDAEAVMAVYEVDVYPNTARLNGAQAYVFAYGSAGISRTSSTTDTWFNGVSQAASPPDGTYDYFSQGGPGVGIELDYSAPFAQAWQLDITSRSTFAPYARYENFAQDYGGNEDPPAQTIDQNWQESLSLNLGWSPDTRTSVGWTNQCSAAGGHYDISRYDFDSRSWPRYQGYDDFGLSASSTLSYSVQLAPYLVGTVSAGLAFNQDDQWDQSPVLASPDAQAGEPVMLGWSQTLNMSVTWRVL